MAKVTARPQASRTAGVALLEQAEHHARSGRMAEAEALLVRALSNPVQRGLASGMLGELRFNQGRYDEALENFEEAISRQPTERRWYVGRSAIHARCGRDMDALYTMAEAVERLPKDPILIDRMGIYLNVTGSADKAALCHAQACELDPSNPEPYFNLGNAFLRQNQLDAADEVFQLTLEMAPNDMRPYANLSTLMYRRQEHQAAVDMIDLAFERGVVHAVLWRNRGHALFSLDRMEEAEEAFENALALDPDDGYCKHWLAMARGQDTDTATKEYVEQLFNGYASTFEQSLIFQLGYRVPGLLRKALDQLFPGLGETHRFERALDLGCGTGLIGLMLHDAVGELVGVDLSKEMLREAESKKLYDRLIQGDIIEVMEKEEQPYPLIIAADVLVYIGDIAPTLKGAAERLQPGGLLIFSVEADERPGYHLLETGRYAHHREYVADQIAASGLEEVRFDEVGLRQNAGRFLSGFLVILRKPAA